MCVKKLYLQRQPGGLDRSHAVKLNFFLTILVFLLDFPSSRKVYQGDQVEQRNTPFSPYFDKK
jgi:hypothetical protein